MKPTAAPPLKRHREADRSAAGTSRSPRTSIMASASPRPLAWLTSTFTLAMLGGLLHWLALPPVGWSALAWIAPVPWVVLARRDQLPGCRPYRALWLAGLVFWLTALYWLTLPHWATNFGWLALSFYLSFYLPVFVGLTRVAVHRCRISVILAAPVVWTGLELVRGHLFTGFTMASLGHTQHQWIELIQIADLAGAYGVGFVVMLAAACLARIPPIDGSPWSTWPLAPLAAVLGAVLLYGHWRTGDPAAPSVAKVALIQGSIDTTFEFNPNRPQQVYSEYDRLTRQALGEHPDIDLLIWPETMFGAALGVVDPEPADASDDPEMELVRRYAQRSAQAIAGTARDYAAAPGRPAWLVGVEVWRHRAGQPAEQADRYNSALFVEPDGTFQGRYDKMHPVMFGEYVPFGNWFPWLYRLTPMSGGIERGAGPRAFRLGELKIAPSICYETVIPHLIRRQVIELREQGNEPDVLVNLTNDGWFWGSAELDMHLACGVFRAVECRKPLLVAANTGFSAWIDAAGRIRGQGPRRANGVVVAEVAPDGRNSMYLRWGDILPGLCLAGCIVLAIVGTARPRRPAG
jgi:apolipoprotein N-acyltransferase